MFSFRLILIFLLVCGKIYALEETTVAGVLELETDDVENVEIHDSEVGPIQNISRHADPAEVESEAGGDDDDETMEDQMEGETKMTSDMEKFMGDMDEVVRTVEQVEFVALRLKFLARSAPSNIDELRELREKEMAGNYIYKQAWERMEADFRYRRNRFVEDEEEGTTTMSGLREEDDGPIPDDYHIALMAYTTSAPPLYSDFNKATRHVCSGSDIDRYEYKSYFKLLTLAIQRLSKSQKFRNAIPIVYRGVSGNYRLKVGQIIAFQQFVSTTSNKGVASSFSASGTIFEIHGLLSNSSVSMRQHSAFPSEDEYLVHPSQLYQVEKIQQRNDMYGATVHTLIPYYGTLE